MAEIKFISSPAWLLLIAAIALVLSLALYYRYKGNSTLTQGQKWFLGFLRFGVVFLIGTLLLSPLIKRSNLFPVKPYLLVALDNSKSLSFAMDSLALQSFWENLNSTLDNLSVKYDVHSFTFGEEIQAFTDQKPDFNERNTNISSVYAYLQKHFKSNNPGAVLLATDGLYNKGQNPLYPARNAGVPTYALGLGDTSVYRDLAIKNVFHNNLAYLNDRIKIQVDLQASKAHSFSSPIQLKKKGPKGWESVESQQVAIEGDNFFTTLAWEVEAGRPGQMHLRLEWEPLVNELTLANNTRDLYIDILDNRKKIRLLAQAPHPDIAAIKRALESEMGNEVKVIIQQEGMSELFDQVDLVVLHQLPSRQFPLRNELKRLKEKQIPTLFVVGSQTDLPALNRAQNAVAIGSSAYRSNDVSAAINPNFALFLLDPLLAKTLQKYPPLQSPFGEYSSNPSAVPLFFQEIKKIQTEYPLLTLYDELGWKIAVLTAENIWRWRIFNYLEEENFEIFDPLINSTLRYLSTQEDKRRFKVFLTNNQVDEMTSIGFGAELYNPNYEPINAPEVKLTLTDEQKNEYAFLFSRTDPFYRVSIGNLPAGNYQYTAGTTFNGEALTAYGQFTVKKIEIESSPLTADYQLLHTIGQQTGGRFYLSEDLKALESELLKKDLLQPLLKERSSTKPLVNVSLLGMLLLLLLSMEWFLRKYWGLR